MLIMKLFNPLLLTYVLLQSLVILRVSINAVGDSNLLGEEFESAEYRI